jgi:hypothetical protein
MRRIVLPTKPFSLLAALCVFVGIAASRVRSAEAPAAKLVVQVAVYGDLANDKTVDVTRKVADMVKDNSLWVKASAGNFGDPAPNAAKKLKVGYTVDGVYRSKTVDEGEALDISTRLVIRKAVYGDLPKGQSADVTEDVAALVQKNSLSVKATNEAFGDPANGKVKKLRVDYTFDGKEKSKTVSENETLTIPAKGE